MRAVLINGESKGLVSPFDRGLNYGDGLFETVAVFSSRPCLWQRHLERLRSGCERLGLLPPSADELLADLDRLLEMVPRGDGGPWVFKIVLTRGSGGRGYRPGPEAEPLRICSLHDWPAEVSRVSSDGLIVRTCETRLGNNTALAGLKHLCRLEQVLARREWSDPGIDEGLMLDRSGHPIEATSSNLFLQRHGRLFTPDLDSCGVAGVVRALILDLARQQGTPVRVQALALQDLAGAEALYLSNSIAGIRRVRRWNDHDYDPAVTLPDPIVSAMELIHIPC